MILVQIINQDMTYPTHSYSADRSYSTVVIKDELRFWKRILIVDDDVDYEIKDY